ncbi:MAG TPA: DUF4340 domain-containing protein [Polyangia bacterium]|nr:DUF4340 domain-containing protein [Polyangia bacterium]
MTGKGVAIQGGLAIAGLLIAYTTWQREPERAAGDVVIIDSTKAELGSVHYEDENSVLDVTRRQEGGETNPWLHVEDKTPVAAADKATPPAHPPTPPKTPHPPRDLRGDEPAEKFLTQFTPFRSPRAFGVLDADKSKELGLADAKKKLIITARGEKREFLIGQPPGGGSESYLRDTKDGRTYLMPRTLMSDLQGASHRLVDRRIHTFKVADFDRLTVTAGGKSRDFVISNRTNPTAYKLAPAATPDKPDETARNWHEKVWRMFPTEVLGKGEVPPGGEPQVALKIAYFDGTRSVGWLEVGKLEVPAPAPAAPLAASAPPPAPRVETYARTEHTVGWVRLNNDGGALQDAEKLVSGS